MRRDSDLGADLSDGRRAQAGRVFDEIWSLWSDRRDRHAAYQEIVSVAETVRASDLDWTIVRLAVLDNKAKTGRVRAGYLGRGQVGTSISHAEIASFTLQ